MFSLSIESPLPLATFLVKDLKFSLSLQAETTQTILLVDCGSQEDFDESSILETVKLLCGSGDKDGEASCT